MISATMVDANTYQVIVEGDVETSHTVTLDPDYYRKLCSGTVTHEWVLIQSFRFLLEREPNPANLASFDLQEGRSESGKSRLPPSHSSVCDPCGRSTACDAERCPVPRRVRRVRGDS